MFRFRKVGYVRFDEKVIYDSTRIVMLAEESARAQVYAIYVLTLRRKYYLLALGYFYLPDHVNMYQVISKRAEAV